LWTPNPLQENFWAASALRVPVECDQIEERVVSYRIGTNPRLQSTWKCRKHKPLHCTKVLIYCRSPLVVPSHCIPRLGSQHMSFQRRPTYPSVPKVRRVNNSFFRISKCDGLNVRPHEGPERWPWQSKLLSWSYRLWLGQCRCKADKATTSSLGKMV
jgi:hypothetical protein